MGSKINFSNKVLTRLGRLDQESVQGYVAGLLQTQRELEQILDQINEGILILDSNGVVKFANQRAFLWLGFQRYLKDRSLIRDLIEEAPIQRFLNERLKKPKESVTEEIEVLTPRAMWLRCHWASLEMEENEKPSYILRVENLTPEKKRTLEESEAHQIEGLVRLAAGVAHEIGNPLNSIQIHLELLKQEAAKLSKAQQKSFNRVIEVLATETKRLDLIVRSFLRASRRPPLRYRKESLNEVLEEAARFLRLEMEKKKIRLRVAIDPKIPEFLLDRDRLHQAFINLLKNAVEAMPRGGAVQISTRLREKVCLVRFEDEGQGIEDSDLPHIFEPYYTTKEEGSGLGLSQVYQTVREHGGRIDVKSQLGKGSIFTLAFPLRQEPLSLPQPEEEKR